MSHFRLSLRTLATGLLLAAPVSLCAQTKDDLINLDPFEVVADPWGIPTGSMSALELTLDAPGPALDAPDDLSGLLPNFAVTTSSTRSYGDIYAMRGVGNTPFFSAPGVLFTVDDVSFGELFSLALPLQSFHSIEILAGPQLAATGFNAPAGVINLRTQLPSEEFGGKAKVHYSRFDSWGGDINANVPIKGSNLGVSIRARYDTSDGYIDNVNFDRPLDSRESAGAGVTLRWLPREGWDLRIGLTLDQFNDGAQRLIPLGQDPYTDFAGFKGFTDTETTSQWLRLERTFEHSRLLLILTRRTWDMAPFAADLDFTTDQLNPFFIFRSSITQEIEQYSQEIRLESDHREDIRWKVGLSARQGEAKGDNVRFINTFVDQAAWDRDERNLSLFGEIGWKVGRKWDFLFSARLDYTEIQMLRSEPGPAGLNDDGSITFFGTGTSWEEEVDNFRLAPGMRIRYSVSETITAEYRFTYGFKPAGIAAYTDVQAFAPHREETNFAHEVSLGWSNPDRRFRIIMTAFWYELDNYHVERSLTQTDYVVLNADEARSRGVELTMQAELIDGLTFSLAAGYTDFEFVEYVDPLTGEDFSGKAAPFIPEFTLRTELRYQHESGFGAAVGLRAQGKTHFEEANLDVFTEDAYALLDAEVSYQLNQLGIRLFGRNLTDEFYYEQINAGLNAGTPSEPRLFGLELTYLF